MNGAVSGWKETILNLSKYEKNVVDRLVTAVQITQAEVVNEAKANHPYTDRTQTLTKSIQAGDVIIKQGSVDGNILALADYASFVEFGTSRSQAYPFLGPAILKSRNSFNRRVDEAFGGAKP